MAINKAKKTEIVKKVGDILDSAKSLVFVNFHKMPVSETTEVRRALRENKLGYYVAKKSLVKRVLEGASIKGTQPSFDGELALVYGEDALVPAKEIYTFQKKLDGRVSILGGIFEGEYRSKSEMEVIATIPGRETLYAMFLNVINSPIQGVVMALNAIADKKEN